MGHLTLQGILCILGALLVAHSFAAAATIPAGVTVTTAAPTATPVVVDKVYYPQPVPAPAPHVREVREIFPSKWTAVSLCCAYGLVLAIGFSLQRYSRQLAAASAEPVAWICQPFLVAGLIFVFFAPVLLGSALHFDSLWTIMPWAASTIVFSAFLAMCMNREPFNIWSDGGLTLLIVVSLAAALVAGSQACAGITLWPSGATGQEDLEELFRATPFLVFVVVQLAVMVICMRWRAAILASDMDQIQDFSFTQEFSIHEEDRNMLFRFNLASSMLTGILGSLTFTFGIPAVAMLHAASWSWQLMPTLLLVCAIILYLSYNYFVFKSSKTCTITVWIAPQQVFELLAFMLSFMLLTQQYNQLADHAGELAIFCCGIMISLAAAIFLVYRRSHPAVQGHDTLPLVGDVKYPEMRQPLVPEGKAASGGCLSCCFPSKKN
jgi:hypothetical protein